MDTSIIRADKKRERAALPAAQIAAASIDINSRLWRQPFMARARRIAAYAAIAGEVDCRSCWEVAWRRRRELYLPVVCGERLRFARYCAKTPIFFNEFGIPEPACPASDFLDPGFLDVVLTPLVAFDGAGNRIGMGSGYYDRSFSFLMRRDRWRRPRLVGLAYEFQKTAPIKASGWDVPLHAVVTEQRSYDFC